MLIKSYICKKSFIMEFHLDDFGGKRKLKLGQTHFWVCGAKINAAFDRFERIQKPILADGYFNVIDKKIIVDHSLAKYASAKIVAGKKQFDATHMLRYFDNEEECIKCFNEMIDVGIKQHAIKIEQMQVKLDDMIKMKIIK